MAYRIPRARVDGADVACRPDEPEVNLRSEVLLKPRPTPGSTDTISPRVTLPPCIPRLSLFAHHHSLLLPIPLPLSISIVCKNNADTIGRTLESLRPLDPAEIIAVDSGSTDATLSLLQAARATIIASDWLGHIKTKQKALTACTQPWILCIDSDESIEPELTETIRAAITAPRDEGSPSGFEINRRTYYRNQPLRHVWQPEWRLRLVRQDSAAWGGHDPHDSLRLNPGMGQPARLPGILRHDSFPTFAEHLRKQWQHATTMAQSLHAAGTQGSYFKLLTSPPGAFLKQLIIKQGFRDGFPGWLAAASTACAALIKHAVLIELSRNAPSKLRDSATPR